MRRALLATLLLAQGTPMLQAGDEIGLSQGGNNNAWNQDNPTGWIAWVRPDIELSALVEAAAALRRRFPLLRHERWFSPRGGEPHVVWLAPDGRVMEHAVTDRCDAGHVHAIQSARCLWNAEGGHAGTEAAVRSEGRK